MIDDPFVVPDGWYVLWCPTCLVSLAWTGDDAETYGDMDSWSEARNWAVRETGHGQECRTDNEGD